MKRRIAFVMVVAVAVSLLADGLPVTSEAATFRFFSNGTSVFGLTNTADVASWPIVWQTGETVTATARDGIVRTLTENGSSTSASLPVGVGGVWHVVNSNGESATICIPWSAFGDQLSLVSLASSPYGFDTLQEGPDRKTKKSGALPVAYSGDDWVGDLSKAATLTFTPPEGSGLDPTTLSKSNPGTGAQSFMFNKVGDWTVTLTFANGTTRTATITIEKTGFVIIVK